MRIDVRNTSGKILYTAIAEECLQGMFVGHQFAVHHNLEGEWTSREGFIVAHVATGRHIASGSTPGLAIEAARARLLEKGQAALDAAAAAQRMDGEH